MCILAIPYKYDYLEIISQVKFREIEATAVPTPAIGSVHMFMDNDVFYYKTSSGSVIPFGIGGGGSGNIESINGLSEANQTIVTGVSGNDFNIVSSGSIHTLNIPTASPSSRGLLSPADYNIFQNKVPQTRSINTTNGIQGGGNLTGDLSLSLTDTGVTAGEYINPTLTVDSKGRVLNINNGLLNSEKLLTTLVVDGTLSGQSTLYEFTNNENFIITKASFSIENTNSVTNYGSIEIGLNSVSDNVLQEYELTGLINEGDELIINFNGILKKVNSINNIIKINIINPFTAALCDLKVRIYGYLV